MGDDRAPERCPPSARGMGAGGERQRSPGVHRRARGRRTRLGRALLVGVGLAGVLVGACARAGTPSVLDANGPDAARTADLFTFMVVVAAAVAVVVIGLLLAAVYRPRPEDEGIHRPSRFQPGDRFIAAGGFVIPTVILIALLILTVRTLAELSHPSPVRAAAAASAANGAPPVTVQFIGHDWWWEVRYPDLGITTANEIHIPVGQPVTVQLSSDGVIHSFWVPQLRGKLDMIPGKINETWIQADRPGVFRGECAEYCGVEHAHMAFLVVAQAPLEFEQWVKQEQQPAAEPTDPQVRAGMVNFMRVSCISCHTIQGTAAQGRVGPDLTHVGSRQTLAAGTLENTPDNMTWFINDPQTVKPGNHMPYLAVDTETARTITNYLETLK